MRASPERVAWTVTLSAFAAFMILIVSVPLSIRYYLVGATRLHEVKVQCLEGTAVVEDPKHGGARPVLKGETISVPEGVVVSVDETAQVVLTFFDQSLVRLFPSSSVVVERMRSPRFGVSPRAAEISLYARGGRIWANTVLRGPAPVEFRVKSLQADTILAEDGGYTIEVTNERTEVIVQRGTAEVHSAGSGNPVQANPVVLTSRQRTLVAIGKEPVAPMKAERDLLTNGDFRDSLDAGWITFNDQGGDGGAVNGNVNPVLEEGRRAVRFVRTGGEFNHCETGIRQEMNRDLPDTLTTLRVRATIKVSNQSLSGGGYLSSEYPLMIQIRYRDAYLSETEWTHGFYFQNFNNNPTQDGEEVPQGKWSFYESENLLEVLPISPRRIVSVRIYASGWSYESFISEISLLVE